MNKEINIVDWVGTNLSVRSTIVSLFEELENLIESEITMNFNNVSFISRSCTDEYLKQKAKSDKKITEKNMSRDILTMIQVVKSAKRIYTKQNTHCLKVALL